MIRTRTTIWFLYIVMLLHVHISQAANEKNIANNPSLLHLHIHTLSFIKNDEYFNSFVEGHTLAGHHIYPYLKYTTSENITMLLGCFARRSWAEKQLFSLIEPTFRLQYQYRSTNFLIGNLEGGSFHRLLYPLYDIQRSLTNSPETGLQLYYANQHTFLDIWLHWITLLNKKDNIAEELVAGLSYEQVLRNTSSIKIKFPLQMILYHLGGQGITVKDFSLWVGAIGARIDFPIGKNSLFKSISLNNYYIVNRYIKNVARPFKVGHAFLSQLIFHTNWFILQGSYWNGYGFSSENLGHPLYQSLTIINKQVTHQEKHRHLLLLHLCLQHQVTSKFKLILQINPYYDISHHLLEHEAGLYIIYSPYFKLNMPFKGYD